MDSYEDDGESFRFDSQAKSFQLKGFRWNAAAVVFGCLLLLLTVFSIVNALGGLNIPFLTAKLAFVLFGFTVGFWVAVWVFRKQRSSAGLMDSSNELLRLPPLSDRVKSMADFGQKIEAVKLCMDEAGVGIAEAKQAVEYYLDRTNRH